MATIPDIVVTEIKKTVSMVWTATMEETLFESLVRICRIGKRAESGFKQEAWIDQVKDVMDDDFWKPYLDLKKCKSKVDINKQRYREFVHLLHKSGWGFDESTQRFTATPEMWDEHINVSIYLQLLKSIINVLNIVRSRSCGLVETQYTSLL